MQRVDKYEIIAEIGQGGMGVVYKAFHPHLKKYVALKEVRADIAEHGPTRWQFEQEAQLLAQLPPHPHLVTVRDAFEWQGRLYLVMDYLEGGSLKQQLGSSPVEARRAVAWLQQILSGLAAIHQRGIVHRDIKPGNILIDSEGHACLSDFGIAVKQMSSAASSASPPPLWVTAQYAAPEMLNPALPSGAEQQTDLYAVGMLAYEMLLGQARFRQVFAEVYAGPPDRLGDRWLNWHANLSRLAPGLQEVDARLPQPLSVAVSRLMAKDVHERYRDAAEARRDLLAWLDSTQSNSDGVKPMNNDYEDATVQLNRNRRLNEPPNYPVAPAPRKKSSMPLWVKRWWLPLTLGAGLLLAFFILPWLMRREPGFTLVVKGAPPDSLVIVDDLQRGIPGIGAASEGTPSVIRVHGLTNGKPHFVCVSCNGSGATLRQNNVAVEQVTSQDGAEVEVSATCEPAVAAQALTEIDYSGTMVLIPAGKFLMGENGGKPEDGPQNERELPYDYYIDKLEVTNRAYLQFCQEKNHPRPSPPKWDLQYLQKPDFPVVGVSWHDARAFAEWAGKQLPSEAEWEKAASWDAQSKSKRKWPWGENEDSTRVIFNVMGTQPAGRTLAGASFYGVLDMAGNVLEWTRDNYAAYPWNKTPSTNFDPQQYVLRGGSFGGKNLSAFTTTHRYYQEADLSPQERAAGLYLIGFRCMVRSDSARLQQHLQNTGQSNQGKGQNSGCVNTPQR